MKNVAIFGGSFNPFHNGHLKVIEIVSSFYTFDTIYVVPCQQNPLKNSPHLSKEKRLKAIQEYFKHSSRVKIITYEIDKDTPSYTIDTIRYLKDDKTNIFLIIGSDEIDSLPRWKDIEGICKLVIFVVISRPGYHDPFVSLSKKFLQTLSFPVQFYSPIAEGLNISSTEIRQMIERGESVEHLIPKK